MNTILEKIFENPYLRFHQLRTLCENLGQKEIWDLLKKRLSSELKKGGWKKEEILNILIKSNHNIGICKAFAETINKKDIDYLLGDPTSYRAQGEYVLGYELILEIAIRAGDENLLSLIARQIKKKSPKEKSHKAQKVECEENRHYSTRETASERECSRLDRILFEGESE